MKILSLFDGISCARVALERAGIPVELYWAVEIDKYATQISQKNYPDIIRTSDVRTFVGAEKTFDLIIGGSPCQDLSIAKKDRRGLDGERSGLFWEYVRILKEVKPKYFILENVASMPKEAKAIITEALGVEPIMINASLVSAQNRKRLFWTNIPNVTQPQDRGILLKDILEENVDEKYFLTKETTHKIQTSWGKKQGMGQAGRVRDTDGKSVTLQAGGGGTGAKTGLYAVPVALRNRGEGKKPEYNGTNKANSMTTVQTDSMIAIVVPEATKRGYALAREGQSVDLSFPKSKTRRGRVGDKVKNIMTSQSIGVVQNMQIRKLTPIECERLQGLPDNYTDGISNSQRYKCLGNAFNVDVVAHILSFIK